MLPRKISTTNTTSTVPTGCSGIPGIIFCIIWILFSLAFVYIGFFGMNSAKDTSNWVSVPCLVDSFNIRDHQTHKKPFLAVVSYRYTYNGREYTGNRLYPAPQQPSVEDSPENDSSQRESEYHKLFALKQKYFESPTAECFVNPQSPGESTLLKNTKDSWGKFAFALFGICFAAIGVGILLTFLSAFKKSKVTSGDIAPITTAKAKEDNSKFIAIPFFFIFGAAGVGMFFFMSVPLVKNTVRALSWTEVPATVVWSEVRESSDSDGTTYRPDIFFRYEYDGKEYFSNRRTFMTSSSSGRSGKEEIVDAHPKGKEITCFVNPDKPWESVLNRWPGWAGLFALFPLPFLAVGVYGIFHLLKKKKQTRINRLPAPNSISSSHSTPANSGSPVIAISAKSASSGLLPASFGEPITFEPGKSRIAKCIGMFFFAAVWNGVVSIFLFAMSKEWKTNDINWIPIIFFCIFGLVGILLIIGFINSIGALFNPRPRLTFDNGLPVLGQNLSLSWTIPDGASRLRDLKIFIVGEESATYRRGTDTTTEKSKFYEAVFFESTTPEMFAQGRASMRLPDNLMASWEASNNKIIWTIHVKGAIAMWPDIDDSYPLTVLPSRS